MMCYVSGNLPPAPDRDSSDSGAADLDGALSGALSALRNLPATAQEWERRIPDFLSSVSRLMEEKAAQLRWAEEFDAILQSVRDTYPELLEFFEQDTQEWTGARVSPEADSGATLRLANRLQSQLADYQAIHERATGISEELERAEKRLKLQPSILETMREVTALMTEDVPVKSTAAKSMPSGDTASVASEPARAAAQPVKPAAPTPSPGAKPNEGDSAPATDVLPRQPRGLPFLR